MKVIYELPKPYGGQLTVTDSELVPLGDVMAYKELTYRRPSSDTRPGCELVFQVRNGAPYCISLKLSADDGCVVRPKDLNALSLEKMRDDLFAYVGVFRENPDGGWVHTRGSDSLFRRDRKAVEKAVSQSRRKMTDEFKQQIADVYNGAPAGTRIAAIKAAFGVEQRQAIRYKQAAQEARLISDE